MKILKPGHTHPDTWLGQCGQCHAIVEATTPELIVTPGDYRSDNEDFAYADCPACEAKNRICFHRTDSKSAATLRLAMEQK